VGEPIKAMHHGSPITDNDPNPFVRIAARRCVNRELAQAYLRGFLWRPLAERTRKEVEAAIPYFAYDVDPSDEQVAEIRAKARSRLLPNKADITNCRPEK